MKIYHLGGNSKDVLFIAILKGRNVKCEGRGKRKKAGNMEMEIRGQRRAER